MRRASSVNEKGLSKDESGQVRLLDSSRLYPESPTSTNAATHPPFRLLEERNLFISVAFRDSTTFVACLRYKKIADYPARHCIILSMNAAPEMMLVMGQTPFSHALWRMHQKKRSLQSWKNTQKSMANAGATLRI